MAGSLYSEAKPHEVLHPQNITSIPESCESWGVLQRVEFENGGTRSSPRNSGMKTSYISFIAISVTSSTIRRHNAISEHVSGHLFCKEY